MASEEMERDGTDESWERRVLRRKGHSAYHSNESPEPLKEKNLSQFSLLVKSPRVSRSSSGGSLVFITRVVVGRERKRSCVGKREGGREGERERWEKTRGGGRVSSRTCGCEKAAESARCGRWQTTSQGN